MSKYENLNGYLRRAGADSVRLTFAEVEEILGFKLPDSAARYPAWWSNNPSGHSHSQAWVKAGWRSEQVDIGGRKVTFRRKSAEQPSGAGVSASVRPAVSPFGGLRGTVTFTPDVDLTLPTGETWEADGGGL